MSAIALAIAVPALAADRVKTANGIVEGTTEPSGIHAYRGIPFAAPPIGDLRWKAPQPVKNWDGVKTTTAFGPRCMQGSLFGDMVFRSNGMSEDCLYLNVWTPAKSASERLPVLVYFFGGGFVAGDGSEPRYDGESMAKKGIVALTVNYRLGVFGFMAHPELTKESPHHASGNYAFLDQNAALQWVQKNIAAFGGDPKRVTIAGESAGSIAVSAQMVSPLSKGLIAGAIGESGGLIAPTLPPVPLAQAEKSGAKFAADLGATSLAALRAMSTQQVFEAATKGGFASVGRFPITIDGYFFTEPPAATFAAGRQSHVPLLVGWNSEEMTGMALLRGKEPTAENYEKAVREQLGARADEALKLYPAATREEVMDAATALAGDRFIGYSTWKWSDMQAKTGGKAVYRYFYARPRPAMSAAFAGATPGLAGGVTRNQTAAPAPPPARGAVHTAEIEYALGNLAANKVYAWTPEDYKVSKTMQEYFANFIKKGNPNGPGLPAWPAVEPNKPAAVMRLDVESRADVEAHRNRYLFLDQF
jgi:para-nitrobenzyl esterase